MTARPTPTGAATTGSADAGTLAATYYRSWQARDFATLRSILADDVTFRGPLGTADGADACVAGVEGMSRMVTDVVVRHIFGEGDDAVTWFVLHTEMAPPCPTATWIHAVDGRIATIEATFDPRPLLPPSAS
jgi:SnoaL-like domain